MTTAALEGIKVLDFTWAALGPITCDYFAAFGAEVIKVETENRPDPWRTMSPFAGNEPGLDRSGLFAFANAEKYSMALNLKHPRGIEVAQRLVRRADVVVESYTPGSMNRLGLGYEDLKKIRPDIIMLSTCMYGQTGSFASLPGFGLTLTGAAGISHLAGWPDRPPLPSGAYTDFVVPKFNVLVLLAALDYRRRTGRGQYLDVSQLEAALHFQIPVLLEYLTNGRELERIGNRSTYAAPQGVYCCKGENSWCAIAIESDQDWKSFCLALGKPEWMEDLRFKTRLARMENLEQLNGLIEEWTRSRDAEEVMRLLQSAEVSAGVAQNGEQLDHDPQLKHRKYYHELDHSEMGKVSYSGFSMKMSATPYEIKRGAPRLGEHTEYVCSEILKMTNEEFVQLLNDGVFE